MVFKRHQLSDFCFVKPEKPKFAKMPFGSHKAAKKQQIDIM